MATILYGISNCDTVKKAQKWLTQNNIPYTFHDFRKDDLDHTLVQSFLNHLTWTDMLNKRSTTYRQLTEQQKETLNAETVINLFVDFPTLIKRPLLIHDIHYQVGFKADNYQKIFSL